MSDEYYSKSFKTILVPVRIRYYDTIDMFIDFKQPEHGEVANAMREDRKRRSDLYAARVMLEEAVIALRNNSGTVENTTSLLERVEEKLKGLLG